MDIDRRTLLGAGLLGALAVGASGCAPFVQRFAKRPLPEDVSLPDQPEPTQRLLDRVAFGALPGQVRTVRNQGHEAYLEEQLAPDGEEDPLLQFWLSRLDVNRLEASALRDLPERVVLLQLRQNQTLRAVYGRWQLHERMVDFWSNHFNIYAQKNWGAFRLGTDDAQVIRKHALGNFHDLLLASAKSVSMLGYLDNYLNEKGVANENYARELMELHTMGVHGGYQQQDVEEVARVFTGWRIEDQFLRPRERFRFDADKHDSGTKRVLGRTIPPGQAGGEAVIALLAEHPSTARYLASKLGRYFLGISEGPEVDAAARAFVRSKGDLKATLKPIVFSERLTTGPAIAKRPFDFVVTSIRALAAETDAGGALQDHLEKMGQPLYGWPMPDGYPDRTTAWSGSLLARWNFAFALSHGQISGTQVDLQRIADLVPNAVEAAARLSAPAFQWR